MDLRLQIGFEICQILKSNNIKHFVDFGTLLGLYREKNIIKNDYDFDIFVFIDKEFEIFENFSFLMRKYKLNLKQRGNRFNICFVFDDFVFELYLCKEKDKIFYPLCMENYKMPSFFIDELEKIEINEDIYFNCPRHASTYLKHRYGENFMIPQEYAPNKTNWCNVDYNLIEIKKKYNAYTYGIFDITHYGHYNLFERIKNNFDKLIVGIHSDEDALSYKRKPKYSYKNRKYMIKSCKYVDEIIDNVPLIVTDDFLEKINCDYVIAGKENLDYISKYYQVSEEKLHLIERTADISSTDLLKYNS